MLSVERTYFIYLFFILFSVPGNFWEFPEISIFDFGKFWEFLEILTERKQCRNRDRKAQFETQHQTKFTISGGKPTSLRRPHIIALAMLTLSWEKVCTSLRL